jgi:protein-tyrosine phosphatase
MSSETTFSDVSQVTQYLYLSSWPRHFHVEEIIALNVRLILSMHWIKPSRLFNTPPLSVLWLPTIDQPFTPIPLRVLQRGVEVALPVIRDGFAVLVHCRAGVHRSVAMACCVLIGMGYSAVSAMQLVQERRPVADPYIWYIQKRIHKFEAYWNENHMEKL